MGFMDELKKLTRPYDDDEDDDYLDEEETLDEPVRQPKEKPKTNPFSNFNAESASVSQSSASGARSSGGFPREGKVVNLGSGQPQMQVVLIKPERFETAADIADHLRGKRPVLMNMESATKEVARRMVDFLSGVTYAIDGNIRKIASNTYILTPPNVDLVTEQMNQLDTSGVYF